MAKVRMETSSAWTPSDNIIICASSRIQPTCRACKSSIEKIRVGIIFTHQDGYILMRWFHLECKAPPASVQIEDIEGLEDDDVRPYRNQVEDWLEQSGNFATRKSTEGCKRRNMVETTLPVMMSPKHQDIVKRSCNVPSPGTRERERENQHEEKEGTEEKTEDVRNHLKDVVVVSRTSPSM